jgi:hypothetical protein
MIKIEKINNSYICFLKTPSIHIGDYYNYCLKLLKNYLQQIEKSVNIVLGPIDYDFDEDSKTIRIDIQCEHTLVKNGGRTVNEIIYGKIKDNNENYLIRIDKFDYFNKLDYIIEYSKPNIINISTSNLFDNFYKKIIHIEPTIYDLNFEKNNRSKLITLLNKNSSERRFNLVNKLNSLNIGYENIDNVFNTEELLELYKKTKILINIHQTDHHHTVEELRILPALQNGVIIISEDSPLKETIPYSNYIIWVKYDEIESKLNEINNNYESYFKNFFSDGNLKNILKEIDKNNFKNLKII